MAASTISKFPLSDSLSGGDYDKLERGNPLATSTTVRSHHGGQAGGSFLKSCNLLEGVEQGILAESQIEEVAMVVVPDLREVQGLEGGMIFPFVGETLASNEWESRTQD